MVIQRQSPYSELLNNVFVCLLTFTTAWIDFDLTLIYASENVSLEVRFILLVSNEIVYSFNKNALQEFFK